MQMKATLIIAVSDVNLVVLTNLPAIVVAEMLTAIVYIVRFRRDWELTGAWVINHKVYRRVPYGDMTQFELEKNLSVTRHTVNALELGKYSPSLEVLFKIAAMFDLLLGKEFQSK